MTERIEIPGFRMVELIGRGGMGEVWKAVQVALERVVAIKTQRVDEDDVDAINSFRREAQAAAKLRHAGIIQVYDAGETKGLAYIVMEYVNGVTAWELLDRSEGPLAEAQLLGVAAEIGAALSYSWKQAQIVHRDVKPDNILITEAGSYRLADLGVAQVFGAVYQEDHDHFHGTPQYASPEYAAGYTVSTQADMYSLGATLYHLATAVLPFGGLPHDDILAAVQAGQLTDPMTLNPELSHGFCDLLERLMMKAPEDRYDSWGAFFEDIERVKAGQGLSEGPGRTMSTVQRVQRRREGPTFKPAKKQTQAVKTAVAESVATPRAPSGTVKRTIVVPTRTDAAALPPRRKVRSSFFNGFTFFMFLVIVAAGAWFYPPSQERLREWLAIPETQEVEDMPTTTQAATEVVKPRKHTIEKSFLPPRARVVSTGKTVKSVPSAMEGQAGGMASTSKTPTKWNHAKYAAANANYNRALKIFMQFRQDGKTDALNDAKKYADQAIDGYNSCRAEVPGYYKKKFNSRVRDCSRLLFDIQQSKPIF